MSKIKIITAFLVIVTLLYNITLYHVNENIEGKDFITYDTNCSKIWSSRGFSSTEHDENSLGSIEKAFTNGYIGLEIDFFYDVKMDKFIISHHKPKKDEEGKLHYTLKDGKLLTLEEVLVKYGKNHYFWLDHKNLDRLSKDETQSAVLRLESISKIYKLKDRLYIEVSYPPRLAQYTENGFKTIMGFHLLKENNIFASISSNLHKIVFYLYDITAITMRYGDVENPYYGDIAQENLKGLPIYLFHIKDNKELVNKLRKKREVQVILPSSKSLLNKMNLSECSF